jgi:hypothetical protein
MGLVPNTVEALILIAARWGFNGIVLGAMVLSEPVPLSKLSGGLLFLEAGMSPKN